MESAESRIEQEEELYMRLASPERTPEQLDADLLGFLQQVEKARLAFSIPEVVTIIAGYTMDPTLPEEMALQMYRTIRHWGSSDFLDGLLMEACDKLGTFDRVEASEQAGAPSEAAGE